MLHNILGQTELRNAVHQNAACNVQGFVYGNLIALSLIHILTVYDLFAGSHEIAFVKREDIIGDLFISIGDNPVY